MAKAPKDTRLLIVDDEPQFRDILVFSFRRKGYQVLSASGGAEAFELLKTNAVDAVISDIRMPGGDGVELLDRIREHQLETPIILLVTGFSDLTTEEAHNRGAEALFSKPFNQKTMEEAITRLLTPREERWSQSSEQAEVELGVTLNFPGPCEAVQAKVVSLGRGGMFVTMKEGKFPNVNDAVEFKLSFNGSSPFGGSGVIRWVRTKDAPNLPAGFGIEFTYLAEADRQAVIEYIKAHTPKAFIPSH